MRFGTYYFLQAPPALAHPEVVRDEIEQMVWTEELGFDSIWLTEHHFIDYGLSVSRAVLAAAAAMRTRRVRIGLAAAILPFHDPVRLAEELAIVDILSEGRLDVGVGRGNRPVEFEGYRVPQIENRERFDESLAIIVKARTAERFSFEGRHFTIPEVRVIPKPLQRPHPPIYVVCTSPATPRCGIRTRCAASCSPSGWTACIRCCSRASRRWPSGSVRSPGSSSSPRPWPSAHPTPSPTGSKSSGVWASARSCAG